MMEKQTSSLYIQRPPQCRPEEAVTPSFGSLWVEQLNRTDVIWSVSWTFLLICAKSCKLIYTLQTINTQSKLIHLCKWVTEVKMFALKSFHIDMHHTHRRLMCGMQHFESWSVHRWFIIFILSCWQIELFLRIQLLFVSPTCRLADLRLNDALQLSFILTSEAKFSAFTSANNEDMSPIMPLILVTGGGFLCFNTIQESLSYDTTGKLLVGQPEF